MRLGPSAFEYLPNERLFPSMDANKGGTGFTLTFLIDVIQLSCFSES